MREVAYYYGDPDEWDLDDSTFQDLAEIFKEWNENETVLQAREIMGSGFHFEMRKPYGVESNHVYNGIMSDMPDWSKYMTLKALIEVSEAVIESYSTEGYCYD